MVKMVKEIVVGCIIGAVLTGAAITGGYFIYKSGALQKMAEVFKKKEQIPAAASQIAATTQQASGPVIDKELADSVSEPTAPQAPSVEQSSSEPVLSQSPGGNVIINNYPPVAGSSAGVPWWNAWNPGNTLVPDPNNPPPSDPNVAPIEGIVVYSVGFIPEGSNQYASQATVGQRGALYGSFANKYNTDKNLRGRIVVDGNPAPEKDEVVLVPAETMKGFVKFPYAFETEGAHSLWFSIDGLSDEDRRHNVATNTVNVGPAPVNPNNTPLTFIHLAVKKADTGADYMNDICYTNIPVTVYAAIQNNNDAAVNDIPVDIGIDGSSMGTVPCSFQPNQTLMPGFNHTFASAGRYRIYAMIDPQNAKGRRQSWSKWITVKNDIEHLARDLFCDKIGFWDTRSREFRNAIYAGDQGDIAATVTNRSNRAIDNVRLVLKVDQAVIKDTGVQGLSIPANSSIDYRTYHPIREPGRHSIELQIDPDSRVGQNSTAQGYVTVFLVGTHLVGGEIWFYVNNSPSNVIGTGQTGRIRWRVSNNSWDPQSRVYVKVTVDGVQKFGRKIDLNGGPANAEGWVEDIRFDRAGNHEICLLIDDDKKFPATVTALRSDIGGKIEIFNQDNSPARQFTDLDAYRVKYSPINNGNTAANGVGVTVKIDSTVRKDTSVDIGPTSQASGYVENVVFSGAGQHKVELFIDSNLCATLPVTVVHKGSDGFFGEIDLYGPQGITKTANLMDTYRIKYKAGFNGPRDNTTPQQECLYVNDDGKSLANMGAQFNPPWPDSEEHWVENVKFTGTGPHTLMLSIEKRGGHYTKVIRVIGLQDLMPPKRPELTVPMETGGVLPETSDQGSGPKMLKAKPDAEALDSGFIPNGERDYLDEIYQGEKGSLHGAYKNNSGTDIKNLKLQLLVDGRVMRESVKPLLRAGESSAITYKNYWFNELGRHKISIIVDPDNTMEELDEKNNNIGHYVNVSPRPQPRTNNYSASGASALTGLMGAFDRGKSGTGTTPTTYAPTSTSYVPPRTATTSVVDYGGGSTGGSGTTTKKTPTFKTKGLGQ